MIQLLNVGTFHEAVPGLYEYSSPGAGQSGLKLIVQDNNSLHSAYMEGLNIADGVAANVGIRAKRIVHLPPPYTDCKTEDKEEIMLAESIRHKVGDSFDEKLAPNNTIVKSAYRTEICRYYLSECVNFFTGLDGCVFQIM